MTISIWRYSHLTLAVSSFLFVFLAAITGIILAFEPISNKLHTYKVDNFEEISLGSTLEVLGKEYDEVIDLQVDANGFVLIDAITNDGESMNGYIDPNTGKFLGKRIEKSKFFKVVTNFHRSLFLKSIGRIFIGITSFLLFLIAVSGTILIIKRQQNLRKFFSKIVNENFSQYWHVVLGRLSLLPIILITLTGVYLSLLRFDIIPENKPQHTINYESLESNSKKAIKDFSAFKNIQLDDVKSVEFPFSSDVEDFYTISLKSKELKVNQFSGEIVSEINYSLVNVFTNLSVFLHTGEGSIFWSLILAVACVNILFFIYSGFAITFKRRRSRLKNKNTLKEAEKIILVGSENGSTLNYAMAFHKGLLQQGIKSYIDELNNYTNYPNATELIVITATYGQGEAPSNAKNFLNKLDIVSQPNTMKFSVVAFGSLAYPDFCKYGFEVDKALNNHAQFSQLLEVVTVNDRSFETFNNWAQQWATYHGLKIVLPKEKLVSKPNKMKGFKVTEKTQANGVDNTFLMSLRPHRSCKFSSGDLLAIYPKNDYRERLYSIGKVNEQLHLSVKLHEFGIGSNFLNDQNIENTISARIIKNKAFHFPSKTNRVIMIANGTGIAPFLGMIDENKRCVDTHLYWGIRTDATYRVYKSHLEKGLETKQLSKLNMAYSQQGRKEYVQEAINRDSVFIAKTLQNKGVIMLCGSLAMQKEVLSILEHISVEFNKTPLSHYINNHQIKMDCY